MKKQTLIAIATVTSVAFGMLAVYGRQSTSPNTTTAQENLTVLNADQNLLTNELKTFPDFIYDIGPRFQGIKKSDIETMTSIETLLEREVVDHIANVKSTSVVLVIDDKQSDIRVDGNTLEFNNKQLELLKTSSYSTNFVVRIDFDEISPNSGKLFDSYRSPHHTIVPEYQASYSEGKGALKLFLKESCQSELIGVDPEKLKPAKLYFTVTKAGAIKDIRLDRDSGYPEIDKKMKHLINNTPGTWLPAKNSKGENVNQELVISFGLIGC